MARNNFVAVAFGAVVVGGAVVAAAAFLVTFNEKVTLEYDEEACVLTSPVQPKVYQDRFSNTLKDKRVKWKVVSSQKNDYHWKIDYQASSINDPSKMGTGDYLTPTGGIDDIACTGPQHTKSRKAPKDPAENLSWPYRVRVYECGGETLICELDPIIWIKK